MIFIFQKRNKPKEPPKVPKSAPFFIPTVAGLEPKFATVKEDTTGEVTLYACSCQFPFNSILQVLHFPPPIKLTATI